VHSSGAGRASFWRCFASRRTSRACRSRICRAICSSSPITSRGSTSSSCTACGRRVSSANRPLLRHLIIGSGTLFIERERRRDAYRINGHARDVLASGDTIAIFPEGTTSDGSSVLPFHASLVQPIIDASGHVQPIAICYRSADGGFTEAPTYVGETSFVESLWCVLGERRLVVEVKLGPTLSARARHRRELSREAEAFIRAAVEAPARGLAPETLGRRRLAAR